MKRLGPSGTFVGVGRFIRCYSEEDVRRPMKLRRMSKSMDFMNSDVSKMRLTRRTQREIAGLRCSRFWW